ncbi:M24 family metallopeptidase [Phocicoccus pinnipedialis]|uniref:Putative peptidase n=1 Tax=Phocicoccus pinnipedialis TaxID=110845 RepID=A0A6V7RER1_9BACL|nr:aminopeptidase P family protein [Jeotgalicoccus pinnipedialis]MBP1939315.1 Xaa-Pro aminopeptidase [Jeotgalicoccus pinnipedialis]CAD2075913.1 putative peptidase [Jeotgalicoccus pinnipedialis]
MIKYEKLNQILERNNLDALLIMSPYNRRYVSGFSGSSGAVVYTNDNKYLISDFRYKNQAPKESVDFEFVLQDKGLLPFVTEFLKEKGFKTVGFESEHVNFNIYETLKNDFDLVPLTGEVEKIRMVKTSEEILKIQKACEIVDETYVHILKFVKSGMTELEVRNELEYKMAQLGSEKPSFDTIVASGYRGALPHGAASNKVIERGDMVTLDFGAYYEGYASDITRSFAVEDVTSEMEKVYKIVLESQLKALDEIKAGMTGEEADSIARDVIKSYGYGENFGHSLGHGFGLEVHEGPALAQKSDIVLTENMLITIEPGIYIDNVGGVRIEDDAIVTKDGLKKLTHSTKDFIIVSN